MIYVSSTTWQGSQRLRMNRKAGTTETDCRHQSLCVHVNPCSHTQAHVTQEWVSYSVNQCSWLCSTVQHRLRVAVLDTCKFAPSSHFVLLCAVVCCDVQSQSWCMGDKSSDVTVKLLTVSPAAAAAAATVAAAKPAGAPTAGSKATMRQLLHASNALPSVLPHVTPPVTSPPPSAHPQVNHPGVTTPKLLALEVTYHPACTLDQAAPLLKELADKIIASVGPPQGQGPGQAGT